VAHDTRADAEQAGKEWTRVHGGGEVFTHRDEDELSRIRKGDSAAGSGALGVSSCGSSPAAGTPPCSRV
jgi:hypothetical protein